MDIHTKFKDLCEESNGEYFEEKNILVCKVENRDDAVSLANFARKNALKHNLDMRVIWNRKGEFVGEVIFTMNRHGGSKIDVDVETSLITKRDIEKNKIDRIIGVIFSEDRIIEKSLKIGRDEDIDLEIKFDKDHNAFYEKIKIEAIELASYDNISDMLDNIERTLSSIKDESIKFYFSKKLK